MKHSKEDCIEVLISFLKAPLSDGSTILERFAALPRAQYYHQSGVHERFVYIPGTREDRVLLAAHADTVWDKAYINGAEHAQMLVQDGAIIRGQNPEAGIGADDRAGCAMLWLLQNTGHSLLIMDGEEHSKGAHKLLRNSHKDLYAELNRHYYMLEPDLARGVRYISANVPNSGTFLRDMEKSLDITNLTEYDKAGTDITQFCHRICGICVSCGYRKAHTPGENLNTDEWYDMLCKIDTMLSLPQKRYPASLRKRLQKDAKKHYAACKYKLRRLYARIKRET